MIRFFFVLLFVAIQGSSLAAEPEDILLPSSKKQSLDNMSVKREVVVIFPSVELYDLDAGKVGEIEEQITRNFRDYYPHLQLNKWRRSNLIFSPPAVPDKFTQALHDVGNDMRMSKWESAKNKLTPAIEVRLAQARTREEILTTLKAREKLVEILLRLGQMDQVQEEMRAILAIDIDFVFNPLYFASVWIDEAETIRKQLSRSQKLTLEFPRVLPQSRVWIDGIEMGSAPLQVSDLAPGAHWIRIATPSETPMAQMVQLQQDGRFTSPFEKSLGFASHLVQAVLSNRWTEELSRLTQDEATLQGASKVIIPILNARDDETRVDLIAFDAQSKQFCLLGQIVTSQHAPKIALRSQNDFQWSDLWMPSWVEESTAWGDKKDLKKVSFAARVDKAEDAPWVSIQNNSEANRRKILTVAPRVQRSQPESVTEMSMAAANKSVWFWTAVVGGPALAIGAGVATALFFLAPVESGKSTDFDFTIGSQ